VLGLLHVGRARTQLVLSLLSPLVHVQFEEFVLLLLIAGHQGFFGLRNGKLVCRTLVLSVLGQGMWLREPNPSLSLHPLLFLPPSVEGVTLPSKLW
jgi:hypothetical protein